MNRAKKIPRTAFNHADTATDSSLSSMFGLLPDELLLLVLRFVDGHDLGRLARVDRRLAALTRDAGLWQHHVSELLAKPSDQLWKPETLSWRDCWVRWGRPPQLISDEVPVELRCSDAVYVALDRFLFVLNNNLIDRFEPESGTAGWHQSKRVRLDQPDESSDDANSLALADFQRLEACGDQLLAYAPYSPFTRIVVVLDKELVTLGCWRLDLDVGVVPLGDRFLAYRQGTPHLSWLNREDLSVEPASVALPVSAAFSPLLRYGTDCLACITDGCPTSSGWTGPSCRTQSSRKSNAPFDLYRFDHDAQVLSVESVRLEAPMNTPLTCCLRAINGRLVLLTTVYRSRTTFSEPVIASVEVRLLEPCGRRVALSLGTEARSFCESQTANDLLYVLLRRKAGPWGAPPVLLHCLNAAAKLLWTTSFPLAVHPLRSLLPLSNGQIVVRFDPRQNASPVLLG